MFNVFLQNASLHDRGISWVPFLLLWFDTCLQLHPTQTLPLVIHPIKLSILLRDQEAGPDDLECDTPEIQVEEEELEEPEEPQPQEPDLSTLIDLGKQKPKWPPGPTGFDDRCAMLLILASCIRE